MSNLSDISSVKRPRPSVPLRNRLRSFVAGFVRRRMIRAKDRFLAAAHRSCKEIQRETLRRLLRLNADSEFSAAHGLQNIDGIDEFRSRLPVTDYEFIRPSVDRMKSGHHRALLGSRNRLLMYAVTSGTTAQSKLIPVTQQFVRDYRRGWQYWGMGAYQAHPTLSLLRLVQISSSHDRWRTEDGTPCGNISGLATSMQKSVVRRLYTVPADVADIKDTTERRRAVATFALADPWVGMLITANPSTLLQLMDEANQNADQILKSIHDGAIRLGDVDSVGRSTARVAPRLKANPERAWQLKSILDRHGHFRPLDCWTELSCLGIWTGGSAGTYLPQIRREFGDIPVRDHGLHASEGRMTIPFDSGVSDGLLDIESHFFEFIPIGDADSAHPAVLLAHELETDSDYFILLTTSSGLYRYNIHDAVRCTGFHGTTPKLMFLHKGAHISSITGEKITEAQVVAAVQEAARQIGGSLRQFTLTPVSGDPPGYQLFIDCDTSSDLQELMSRLEDASDSELRRLNCEYDEKRESGRLHPVVCRHLDRQSWKTFQVNRLSASGGSAEQYKHPFLFPDADLSGTFVGLTRLGQPTAT